MPSPRGTPPAPAGPSPAVPARRSRSPQGGVAAKAPTKAPTKAAKAVRAEVVVLVVGQMNQMNIGQDMDKVDQARQSVLVL